MKELLKLRFDLLLEVFVLIAFILASIGFVYYWYTEEFLKGIYLGFIIIMIMLRDEK